MNLRANIARLAAVCLLSPSFTALAQNNKASSPPSSPAASPVTAVAGFASPESALFHNGYVYVSNVGTKLEPSTADGDGYISRLEADGMVIEKQFLPKPGTHSQLNAPKGSAVVGGILYVGDIDRVVGFDLKTRDQVFELSLAATGAKFLNDMAALGADKLLVSATDLNKLYVIQLGAKPSFAVWRENTPVPPGPNGIAVAPNGDVWVNGMGTNPEAGALSTVVAQYPADGSAARLHTVSGGMYDGLAFLTTGTVLQTDWAFPQSWKVTAIDSKAAPSDSIEALPAAKGPADFSVDPATGTFYLPAMMEGVVYVGQLSAGITKLLGETYK